MSESSLITKKYLCFSTFISGFSSVIEKALVAYTKDTEITLMLDGLVVYVTKTPPSQIVHLPFFNNSFQLLQNAHDVRRLLHQTFPPEAITWWQDILKGNKTFRIIVSKENEHISVQKQQLEKLEKLFSQKLRLKVDRANPDVEVWFLERSEGHAFCGIRLTKKPSTEKYLQKGELRPELAWMLCFLSEPNESDIFLDPFAGFGSIPTARLAFPHTKIIASGNDTSRLKTTKDVEVHKWNATHLPLESESIDKIVTDPPWGIFEKVDIEKLYIEMLSEFSRVLKKDGILVVLTAQKELFERLVNKADRLQLMKHYDILVSGKKSGVYKIHRLASQGETLQI